MLGWNRGLMGLDDDKFSLVSRLRMLRLMVVAQVVNNRERYSDAMSGKKLSKVVAKENSMGLQTEISESFAFPLVACPSCIATLTANSSQVSCPSCGGQWDMQRNPALLQPGILLGRGTEGESTLTPIRCPDGRLAPSG